MTALVLTLPGPPPSANQLWRSVGGRVLRSRVYRRWLDGAAIALRAQARARRVEGRWRADIRVGGLSRRRDLDNCVKPLVDALVESGCVPDDRWLDDLRIRRADGDGVVIEAAACPA